jgi:glycosyltransferase involved in cell wall biosynthesis
MPEIAGDAGLVVPAGDRDAFVETVRRLVADVGLRNELAGRARVKGSPDNEELVRQIGETYDDVSR